MLMLSALPDWSAGALAAAGPSLAPRLYRCSWSAWSIRVALRPAAARRLVSETVPLVPHRTWSVTAGNFWRLLAVARAICRRPKSVLLLLHGWCWKDRSAGRRRPAASECHGGDRNPALARNSRLTSGISFLKVAPLGMGLNVGASVSRRALRRPAFDRLIYSAAFSFFDRFAAFQPAQMLSGIGARVFHHILGVRGATISPPSSAFGAQIDDLVGGLDHFEVVLDHHHGIAGVD